MIAKCLSALTSIFVSLCVATMIAEGILLVYYAQTWQIDRQRLVRLLAVAQGADVAREDAPRGDAAHGQPAAEPPSTEQPSYEQILEARAVKARNLELREQALRSGVEQVQLEQRRLSDEKKRLLELREGFQGELAALEKGAAASGREEARRTLETIKPKQAKELIVQMLEKKEIDELVLLLTAMPEAKRAKIFAEFKTPSETEQIGEVLARIRQGQPTSTMAGGVQKQLEPPKGPGT